MKILAIETSCDETAIAVLDVRDEHHITVLSNVISSQIKLHTKYGGVVPNLAAREHVKNIDKVFKLALKQAGIKEIDPVRGRSPRDSQSRAFGRASSNGIDLIAVTRGPGLGPSLLVGLTFARTLAWRYAKPFIGVNHMEGHIYSNWLPPVEVEFSNSNLKFTKGVKFPALNLLVSGGHTELVLMRDHGKYHIIGETLDDAVGEAFDKTARLLGLGYPGGPIISRFAEKGNPDAYPLPRPLAHSKDYNFSYSGLKTAVLYLLRDISKGNLSANSGQYRISAKQKSDIAASFQKAAIGVLVDKTIRAAREHNIKAILLSGGVSANKLLRERLRQEAFNLGVPFFCPAMIHTTDNAAMIGAAAYFQYQKRKNKKFPWAVPQMDANLTL